MLRVKALQSVSFMGTIACHVSFDELGNEPNKNPASVQVALGATQQVAGEPPPAAASALCRSGHHCLVLPMGLFLLLLLDVLKKNAELRKQLRNEGCGAVFSLPRVTHISNEA